MSVRKVPVSVQQTAEGEWWVQSPEAVGFFACGESRSEALENAKEVIALFLGVDEGSIELEITETRISANGEDS